MLGEIIRYVLCAHNGLEWNDVKMESRINIDFEMKPVIFLVFAKHDVSRQKTCTSRRFLIPIQSCDNTLSPSFCPFFFLLLEKKIHLF